MQWDDVTNGGREDETVDPYFVMPKRNRSMMIVVEMSTRTCVWIGVAVRFVHRWCRVVKSIVGFIHSNSRETPALLPMLLNANVEDAVPAALQIFIIS